MRYLVVVRGYNEPDNNTPSDEIMVKVADYEPTEVERIKQSIEASFETDYEHGVEIQIIPIEEIQDNWKGVFEIW